MMSIPIELQQFGVGSIWQKRVAPAAFELRKILAVEKGRVHAESHVKDVKEFFYDYEFVDLFAPLTNDAGSLILAGSGHRPEDIATGFQAPWVGIPEVRAKLFSFYKDLLSWLRPKEIISGLARGFDLWFAWAAVESEIPLIGAAPYRSQASGWDDSDAKEWEALTRFHCKELHFVSPSYWEKEGDNALYARNRWMVDRCTHLTTFFQGTRGGTAWTNDYAIKIGKPRLVINTLNGW